MTARRVLYGLLVVVALAAAVLSFAALRDLAITCGFSGRLAWLLPVVVDAGAAAGSIGWLGAAMTDAARRFARALALTLLALSVVANALGHGLAAYQARPHWLVVVAVSAVAPAVLGAVVHLAVLLGRPRPVGEQTEESVTVPSSLDVEASDEQDREPVLPNPALLDDRGLSRRWADAPAADPDPVDKPDRARELIASGAGRRRLARELGVSEHTARTMIDQVTRTDAPAEAGERSA